MKKKYFSIICVIIILLINYALIYFINNETKESINGISSLKILKQSLTLPGVFFLMDIIFNQYLTNKKILIFTVIIILLEFIVRYFNDKNIVDYNFLIGMFIGLILTIFISSLIQKYDINRLTDNRLKSN